MYEQEILWFVVAGYARDLGNTTNLTAGTMQGTGPITHSAPLQPTIRARTPASSIQPRPVPQHIPVQTTTPAAAAPAAVPQIVSRPNPISTQPAAVQQQPNKKPLSLTVCSYIVCIPYCLFHICTYSFSPPSKFPSK